MRKIIKSEEEWKKELPPERYEICRLKGTEPAFTGQYWDHHQAGNYACACCGHELFESDAKFESGTGWPSFWDVLGGDSVQIVNDTSQGMVRKEVVCNVCGAHLGHVFDDGPLPTGKRYCINSASLKFNKI